MTNTSILAAFERMWQHVINKLSGKADIDHTHDGFMTTENPTGIGSLSMNRKADTTVGDYSSTMGYDCEASGGYSHAEGGYTTASGDYAHAEGFDTDAIGYASHAEGGLTTSSSDYTHAEGYKTTASGKYSHAEGYETTASKLYSHSEGYRTLASSNYQHVQGKYNIEDASNIYAHIVGNGENSSNRSNAHTVDWDGNAWYQGTIKVGGTSYDDASEVALKSDVSGVTIVRWE